MQEFLKSLGLSPEAVANVMADLWKLGMAYAGKIVFVIVVLFLALMISNRVRGWTERALDRAGLDKTLTKFFGGMSKWVVLLLAILGCLGYFGIETTSFAAVLGGASLAVGLAFQGSLSNIAAGVMLLVFRPFKVGDVISVAGHTGGVEEVGLFTTSLNTPDNRHIIIPNGKIFGSDIVNITHNPTRRVDVNIGVSYDADIDETREILVKAANSIEYLVEGEEGTAFLSSFGGSSVDWQVRAVVKTEDYFAAYEALMRATKMELEAADIEIPYPHVQVLGVNPMKVEQSS